MIHLDTHPGTYSMCDSLKRIINSSAYIDCLLTIIIPISIPPKDINEWNYDTKQITCTRSRKIIKTGKQSSTQHLRTMLCIGNTQLHQACMVGNIIEIESLVKKSANIYSLNNNNHTPLMILVQNNNTEAMSRVLRFYKSIKQPVNLNHQADTPHTLLQMACLQKNNKMVKLLIQHSANVRKSNKNTDSPLLLVIKYGMFASVKQMITQIKTGTNKRLGMEPFQCAIQYNQEDMLDYMLPYINIHNTNNNGRTLLCIAVQTGKLQCVKVLLNHGADVNHASFYGDSPLHVAVRCERPEMVNMLLRHNANINIQDHDEETPIFQATMRPNTQIVQALLLHPDECNIDKCSTYGASPLYNAITNNHEDHALVLVKQGAALHVSNAFNNTGQTILQLAFQYNMTQLFRWVIRHHPDTINQQDNHKSSILHDICRKGSMDHIIALLNANTNMLQSRNTNTFNININIQDNQGSTPLMFAVQNGYDHIVDVMLRHHANRYLENHYNESPYKEALVVNNDLILDQMKYTNSKDYHAVMIAIGVTTPMTIKELKTTIITTWYAHSDFGKLSKSMMLHVLSFLMCY